MAGRYLPGPPAPGPRPSPRPCGPSTRPLRALWAAERSSGPDSLEQQTAWPKAGPCLSGPPKATRSELESAEVGLPAAGALDGLVPAVPVGLARGVDHPGGRPGGGHVVLVLPEPDSHAGQVS